MTENQYYKIVNNFWHEYWYYINKEIICKLKKSRL